MKVILASTSPRRAALMELANIDCEIFPSSCDESKVEGYTIEEKSKKLAYAKAKSVFDNTQDDRTIIGADTIVVKDDKIFGKPEDRSDAIKMLRQLQDDIHTVYTSIAILIEYHGKYKEYNEVIKTDVYVRKMDDQEIINYVDTEEPYDKAGSYAIQSSFAAFVDRIEGNYMGIIGLPINRVYEILKENEII